MWESLGGAIVTGAGCGVLLGFTVWGYLAGVLVSFVGGFPAGGQHRTLRGALARGFLGGFLWAASVVVVIGLSGRTATVPLPVPPIAFLPWGIVPACIVAVTGWLITRCREAASRA
ncbi:hypothetical protein [Pseudonocardia broussonetiae]|uniref:Major facilitator superfamily (MFS) profile domain-containing protein n=1 Tax=Pseudonocardia broussonetiae TaxID=2736640 RepID=A0A6M6JH64_9PSEU|nr:hypothetical protein [Pseudonocardia broussonetiae]QJY46062.1 hypothetical protein HOP40_09810 [Pseudonocardia broussonetiae]